jgi:hypothetical protein
MLKQILTIGLALVLCVGAQGWGYQLFGFPQVYSGADAMSDITTVDLNGDNFSDLVSVPFGADYIFVYQNDGMGNFWNFDQVMVGSQPISVTAIDFDSDGDMDLAVSRNTAADNVALLENNGDGTFQAPVYLTADQGPATIRAAMLNGDIYPDLVTVNMLNNTVTVFLNSMSGTFSAATTFAVGPVVSNTVRGLVAQDFDNDGDADLAISTKSSADTDIYTFFNNGDATFTVGTNIPVGFSHGLNIIAAKFDQNEYYDIILPINDTEFSGVLVYLNFGNGTFVGPIYAPAGADPVWVSAADFDCDGLVDVAVANRADDHISVLYNFAGCALEQPDNYSPGFSWVSSVAAADFDGNGTVDLAGTKWCTLCGGQVGVVKNKMPPMVTGSSCNNVPGDVDQDGGTNILDLTYLVDFFFRGGPAASCGF